MAIVDPDSLTAAVEAAFDRTAAGLERWDDPHPPPDRVVADEEYSRVTNPAKWRIVGARLDAWTDVLTERSMARVEPSDRVEWGDHPAPSTVRIDLIVPVVDGGVVVVAGRTRLGDVDEAGVVLGVRAAKGGAVWMLAILPDCGCDACDSGSQDAIDEVDECLGAIVSGRFRMLCRGRQRIVVHGEDGRLARNVSGRGAVDRILADPRGWDEVSGPSWLVGAHREPHR